VSSFLLQAMNFGIGFPGDPFRVKVDSRVVSSLFSWSRDVCWSLIGSKGGTASWMESGMACIVLSFPCSLRNRPPAIPLVVWLCR
jgi:hypothetical protein